MEKYKIEYQNDINKNLRRSNSPDSQLRLARTLNAISNDFASDDKAPRSVPAPRPSTNIGRHSDRRVKRRALLDSSPSIGAVKKKRFLKELDEIIDSSDDEAKRIPNARFGVEVPISNNTSILGSSQYTGCQGDFCDFDLSFLQSKEINDSFLESQVDMSGFSEFRKGLLFSGSASKNYISKQSSLGKMISKADSNGDDNSTNSSLTRDLSTKESKLSSMNKILFRSIIQARQEMPLVKMQLERHKKGEDGPYMRADSFVDTAVGGKVPSHYYQEVPCCLSCYKVYNIVDKARAKAIKAMNREQDLRRALRTASTDLRTSTADVSVSVLTKSSSFSSIYSPRARDNTSLTGYQVEQLRTIAGGEMDGVDEVSRAEPDETMLVAIAAVDGLTKMDVAEIRSMSKPPAAVEVVMEAVMILLTGRTVPAKDMHRLLSGGEAFLLMLREFDIEQVTDERLALVEPYVDNPLFRPENVAPVSYCASKFCAWVHGIVHAVRFEKGLTHPRIDPLRPRKDGSGWSSSSTASIPFSRKSKTGKAPHPKMPAVRGIDATPPEELSFVQKLEKMKAIKQREAPYPISRQAEPTLSSAPFASGGRVGNANVGGKGMSLRAVSRMEDSSVSGYSAASTLSASRGSLSKFDPGPTPSIYQGDDDTIARSESPKKTSKREAKAMRISQKKATDRLASQSVLEGASNILSGAKLFKCSDGITKMPYVVLGKFSFAVTRCSFIVVNDFFDTCDGAAILFKPIVQRHEGCQVLCFNYPGQANTVWPRLSAAERDRGAVEPVLNNDWMADRLHELLQHAEQEGEILLSCPFHLVGMGNGACIAAAFAQRYGYNKMYVNSLRSLVSINGFLYPDPQLSSILHSAYQVFESTPHSRPDIPVSYWSRFVFSEEYLKRVNPNLALNIYTAVSNPITNEGRVKIAKGALAHRDLRGALAPDFVATSTAIKSNNGQIEKLYPLQIPVVMLQSTENTLVNASNVDSFLVGRNCKHLWSHMLNILSDATLSQAADVTGQWVGRMSNSPADYHKFSTLGKPGLKMLMECLRNPRGAMSVWTRTGHAVQQENKAAVLDLLDALACPTDEYTGVMPDNPANLAWKDSLASAADVDGDASISSEQKTLSALAEAKPPPKVGVLFKLSAPKTQTNNEIVAEKETKAHESTVDRLSSPNPSRPQDLSTSPPPSQPPIKIVATISPSLPVARPQEEKEELPSTAQSTAKKPRSPLLNRRPDRDEVREKKETQVDAAAPSAKPKPAAAAVVPTSPRVDATSEVAAVKSPVRSKPALEDLLPTVGDEEKDSKAAVQSQRKSSIKPQKFSSAAAGSSDISTAIAVPSTSTRPEQKSDKQSTEKSIPELKSEPKLAIDSVTQPTTSAPAAVNPIAPKPTYPILPEKINPAQPAQTLSRQYAAPPQQAPPSRQGRSALSTPAPQPPPQHPQLLKNVKDGTEISFESSDSQRVKKEWAVPSHIPAASTALELEAELKMKQKEYLELEEKLKKVREENDIARDGRVGQAQLSRRLKFEEEDRKLLEKLQSELDTRQRERDYAEKQRRLELQNIEKTLVEKGYVPPAPYDPQPFIMDDEYSLKDTNSLPSKSEKQSKPPKDSSTGSVKVAAPQNPTPTPVREMEPKRYEQPPDLPRILTEGQDVISKLDRMLEDEENARKRGTMSIEEYETVKFRMMERQLERDQKLRQFSAEELAALFDASAITIGKLGRGYNGRKRFKKLDAARNLKIKQKLMALIIQRRVRGILGRKRFRRIRSIYLENVRGFFSAAQIQRTFRGFYARRIFRKAKRLHCAKLIQRVFRGHLGRKAVRKERARLAALRRKHIAASKIQSVWRMKVSREEFRGLRIHVLAAMEIQRAYRGYLGRKKINRRKQWESTQPGPERIKLGLQFIEESKLAFERQQEEINALHRAQARAEARVSNIHAELKESEKELLVLERELQEIDQIERDLSALTHERQLLTDGIQDATGMPRLAGKGHSELVIGKESNKDNDPIMDRRRKAEAYALEMTIQLKRAEREKKRQELEIEFAAVFQEVDKKKKALAKLELALTDMESTRERKDREFRRLQKNLMQLLLEQKKELDDLREKGIELETATATTAAAAIATAQKAKEHEKRSTAMFSQTEELMKFQFMSMSLSYFSSLNMLKSLRDMNADTTSAAIAMSADAAAAAAGAAAAANLPSVKKMNLGATDFIEATIQRKKAELEKSDKAEKELKIVSAQSIPDNVRTWTVTDVARWLDALTLSQYSSAFIEASVDGPFLLELREEDLVQVLNIKHKLHVRKILISRDKLKPMSQQEKKMMQAVEIEDSADKVRKELGVPSIDTVFSQARNGRVKRVEESLNQGFKIDTEDERGNTLLLLAAQNSNRKLAEMLVVRGANVNHQNASGNTALHFALAFDKDGSLGEYLIEHGADDSIENVDGLTPYDGIAA